MNPRTKTEEAPGPDVAAEVVWRGAEALRPFLVPIADLEPFPGNPRRGDLDTVRESIRKFGQTRAVLTDANYKDGRRIVAGHHLVAAAAAEGLTHIAVIPHEFTDEEEARKFMLMDNRSHDAGSYDVDLLYEQIKHAQANGGLDGTGYSQAYVDDLDAQMADLRRDVMAPPEFPPLDPDTLVTEHQCPSCGYQWSGNPAPGAAPADAEPDEAASAVE